MAVNPTDELGGVLQDALKPVQEKQLATEAATPIDPVQSDVVAPAPTLDPPPANKAMDPVQVAGMGDWFTRKAAQYSARSIEAEKKILPRLADEPIQKIGDTFVVRPLEQAEADRLVSAIGGDYAKGINFNRLTENFNDPALSDRVGSIKQMMSDTFEELRRGTMNFDDMLAITKEKGAEYYVSYWLKHPVGQPANGEHTLGGLLTAFSLSRENMRLVQEAKAITDPVAREAAERKVNSQIAIEGLLYAKVSGASSENGRAQYVLSQATKISSVDPAARGSEIVRMFNTDDVKEISYQNQMYLTLPDDASRATFAKQGIMAKSMDVMAEVYINSLLSSPVTHATNIGGNTIFMGTRILETGLAGMIGSARSRITGNADRVYVREALGQLQGIRDGWIDALNVAGKTFATEEGQDIASKLDQRSRRAIGDTGNLQEIYNQFQHGNYVAGAVNVLGVSVRMPGRFLLAEDEFFKGVGYRMALHGEAENRAARMYDQAIASGKSVPDALADAANVRASVLNDPPEIVIKNARDAAREMTFQKNFDPNGPLAGAQQMLSHPLMKLFVPFYKTPTNIANAVLERSPLAPFTPSFYSAMKSGGREADMAMAKVSLGSMMMGGLVALTWGNDMNSDVIINGNGPTDPNAKDAWSRRGFLPYSVSVKQDDGSYKSISYNKFDPVSGVLGMAADFAYYAQYETDGSIVDALAMAATMSIFNYMLEQPMLSSMTKFSAAITQRNPKDRTEALVRALSQSVAAGPLAFTPGTSALGANISRTLDPIQRNTMLPAEGVFGEDPTEHNMLFKGFYDALQRAKAQNPFFNKSLPPRLNEWAEPMTQGDGTAWDFVSPIKIKDSKFNMVDEEIQKLGGGMSPTPKKISGIELNALQYNRLITLTNQLDMYGRTPDEKGYNAGDTLLPTLQKMIMSSDYKALPQDDDRADQISHVVGQFRKAARDKLMQEDSYLKAKVASGQ